MSYAVTADCGPVDWSFSAPGGTVVVDGAVSASTAKRSAAEGGGQYIPVVLFNQPPSSSRLQISAGFTPQGEAFLKDRFATVEQELHRMLPGLSFEIPYTLATVAPDGQTWGTAVPDERILGARDRAPYSAHAG
jgi:hypothetical protein